MRLRTGIVLACVGFLGSALIPAVETGMLRYPPFEWVWVAWSIIFLSIFWGGVILVGTRKRGTDDQRRDDR